MLSKMKGKLYQDMYQEKEEKVTSSKYPYFIG